jgi:hypothetical protein
VKNRLLQCESAALLASGKAKIMPIRDLMMNLVTIEESGHKLPLAIRITLCERRCDDLVAELSGLEDKPKINSIVTEFIVTMMPVITAGGEDRFSLADKNPRAIDMDADSFDNRSPTYATMLLELMDEQESGRMMSTGFFDEKLQADKNLEQFQD